MFVDDDSNTLNVEIKFYEDTNKTSTKTDEGATGVKLKKRAINTSKSKFLMVINVKCDALITE